MAPRFDKDFFSKLIDRAKQSPDVPEQPDEKDLDRVVEFRPDRERVFLEANKMFQLVDRRVSDTLESCRVEGHPDRVETQKALESFIAGEIAGMKLVAKCFAARQSLRIHSAPDADDEPNAEFARKMVTQLQAINNAMALALCSVVHSVSDRIEAGEFDFDKLGNFGLGSDQDSDLGS